MGRIEQWVKVKPGAIKKFLEEHDISESCLSGGLYLDEERLNFILTTDKVDLIDAKMLTRFCYRKNINGILEFADERQKRYVFKQARAW